MAVRPVAAVAVLVIVVTFVRGLTKEEIKAFDVTGNMEHNTGLIGWVKIIEGKKKYDKIASNGIPDHETGNFPERRVNPNSIDEQSFDYRFAKNPAINPSGPTCLPMGPIAMATNGIPMYSPWNSDGKNAVEGEDAETFDLCDGHPDLKGRYHYHRQPSSCLFESTNYALVGVAFDGFPIYGPVDEFNNKLNKETDLDECNGRYNSLTGQYQYHTTESFPYILGCYSGTPVGVNVNGDNCFMASDADENGNVEMRVNRRKRLAVANM